MVRYSSPFAGTPGSPIAPGEHFASPRGVYIVGATGVTYGSGGGQVGLQGDVSTSANLDFDAAAVGIVTRAGVTHVHLDGEVWHQYLSFSDVFLRFNHLSSHDGASTLPGVSAGTVVETSLDFTTGALSVAFNGSTVSTRTIDPGAGASSFGAFAEEEYTILGGGGAVMPPGHATVQDFWYETAGSPVCRLYPRDDGRGMSSAPRIWPRPKGTSRIIGGYR